MKTSRLKIGALVCAICWAGASRSSAQAWPAGQSPREVGTRVAARFAVSGHSNFGFAKPPTYITYPEACAWYGALTFANESGNRELLNRLIARFEPLQHEEHGLVPHPTHVDFCVFGAVPLKIYQIRPSPGLLAMGLGFADTQWAHPRADGLSPQTRFWIDDMFMMTLLQVQAFRATGERKYLERAAAEMMAYLQRLQRPNGLFYHAEDVPIFWGRGNGWVASGMTEMLKSLAETDASRAFILASYCKMMAELCRYQRADGLWGQLIDDPSAWSETSGSAMFTFALAAGVKHGWLPPETYANSVRKAWLGLVAHLNANDELTDVCEGTNKLNDRGYYLKRRRLTGDLHGQAPLLWSASELLR